MQMLSLVITNLCYMVKRYIVKCESVSWDWVDLNRLVAIHAVVFPAVLISPYVWLAFALIPTRSAHRAPVYPATPLNPPLAPTRPSFTSPPPFLAFSLAPATEERDLTCCNGGRREGGRRLGGRCTIPRRNIEGRKTETPFGMGCGSGRICCCLEEGPTSEGELYAALHIS